MHSDEIFVHVQAEHYRGPQRPYMPALIAHQHLSFPAEVLFTLLLTLKWQLDAWPGVVSAFRISASTTIGVTFSIFFFVFFFHYNVTLHCR